MKPKDFQKLLARDGYCLHCGETTAVSPNHRINRGMGGSKLRDQPSNLVVLCSLFNGMIESSAESALLAKSYGWKLKYGQDTLKEPVYDAMSGLWYSLDDYFGRSAVE